MRIAIVIDIYNDKGNGTTVSARQLITELGKRGIETIILCRGEERKSCGNFYYFEPVKLPSGLQKICDRQNVTLASPDDDFIREAFKGVDLVHIYLPFWLGTHSAKIAKDMGIPVLGCYHIAPENISYNIGLKKVMVANKIIISALKTFHYKESTIKNIHCPSQMIADVIRSNGYKQNIHIISNGYNPLFYQMKNVKKPVELENKKIIISVGRLTKEKRQDLIIKAVAVSEYREQLFVILAGQGSEKENYEKMAEKFGVHLKCVFLDRAELVQTLNYSDLYIQASEVETEGMSCLEAMACGVVPIISDNKLCAAKQFALGEYSLFESGNEISLANKINFFLKNKDHFLENKKRYIKAAANYSLEKCIDSILMVYKKIIENENVNTGETYNYNIN